jgi:hypothetical protein
MLVMPVVPTALFVSTVFFVPAEFVGFFALDVGGRVCRCLAGASI